MGVSQYPAAVGNTTQVLGYAETSANQGSITTEVALTGLSVSVYVPANRRIKITGYAPFKSTVAGDAIAMRIKEGATYLQSVQREANYTYASTLLVEKILTPSAGQHTYNLVAARTVGSGTVTMNVADYTMPLETAYILVEDITGVAVPASPASTPVGQLGYAEVTANQAGITASADLTGLSVNVVVPAGRILKISASVAFSSTVANDTFNFYVVQDAGIVQATGLLLSPVATVLAGTEITAVVSPSAGVHTYKLQAMRSNGTGSGTLLAAAGDPAWILVEDITPTPALASSAPSSTLAVAAPVADQTGIGAGPTALTEWIATVTVPAGRRLKIHFHGEVGYSDATTAHFFDLYEDGVSVSRLAMTTRQSTSDFLMIDGTAIRSPAAGAHTYQVRVQRYTGSGTLSVYGTVVGSYFLIEDVTGVSYNYTQPGLLPANSSSRPLSPATGAMIYEYDTGRTLIWSGSGWGDIAAGGAITLGYNALPAANQTTSGAVELELGTLTITVAAGRRIRVTHKEPAFTSGTTGESFWLKIYEDATVISTTKVVATTTGNPIGGAYWSAITSPPAGMHVYKVTLLRDNGTGTLTADRTGTDTQAYLLAEDITGTAVPISSTSVPVGLLAQAQVTANQASITTEVDLAGLSVNVVVPAGRTLRIRGTAYPNTGVLDDRITLYIKEGGNYLQERSYFVRNTGGSPGELEAEAIVSPSAGSHTYKLAMYRSAGSGTVTNYASAGYPSIITVEDISPTPAAASTAPSSTLAYAEVTTSQTGITTLVDLTNLTATVNVAAGRRLRIAGHCLMSRSVADGTNTLILKEGGTQITQVDESTYGTDAGTMDISAIISPTAGSHTYKLQMQRTTGTGTASMLASSTYPAYILVEDITGSGISGHTHTQFDDTGWITPVFLNGWVNYDATNYSIARYRKIGNTVYVSGLVKSGTVPSDIFILPPGFRPQRNIHLATPSNAAFGILEILNSVGTPGSVKCNTGSNVWFSIECSFIADV